MASFRYSKTSSFEEARSLLATDGPKPFIFAGGTDLLLRICKGNCSPTHLVDLEGIEGLSSIRLSGDFVMIGALATVAEICRSDLIRECRESSLKDEGYFLA